MSVTFLQAQASLLEEINYIGLIKSNNPKVFHNNSELWRSSFQTSSSLQHQKEEIEKSQKEAQKPEGKVKELIHENEQLKKRLQLSADRIGKLDKITMTSLKREKALQDKLIGYEAKEQKASDIDNRYKDLEEYLTQAIEQQRILFQSQHGGETTGKSELPFRDVLKQMANILEQYVGDIENADLEARRE